MRNKVCVICETPFTCSNQAWRRSTCSDKCSKARKAKYMKARFREPEQKERQRERCRQYKQSERGKVTIRQYYVKNRERILQKYQDQKEAHGFFNTLAMGESVRKILED